MTHLELMIAWLAVGIAGSGYVFADFQGEFPTIAAECKRHDLGLALLLAIFGPITLVIAFFLSGFGKHGWRLW